MRPYQAFKASDDYFVLAAGNQRLFEIVCDTVGRRELLNDPRFNSTSNRAKHQHKLTEILAEPFSRQTAEYWTTTFSELGVPTAPINRYGEVLVDKQVVDQNWVQDLELPNSSMTKTFGHPIKVGGKNLPILRRPPMLDENREEILGLLE